MRHVAEYPLRAPGTIGGPRDLLGLWAAHRGREVVFLNGAHGRARRYRDLVFAVLLNTHHRLTGRPRPRVVVFDATWEPGSRALAAAAPWLAPVLPRLARTAIRAIDGPHLHYAVLSTDETRSFPDVWGVDPRRVAFLAFPHTMWELERYAALVHDGGYLWAGGNSLRDYDLLARAVRGLGIETRVHARWTPPGGDPGITAGQVPHEDFMAAMAGARAVVVPLAQSVRSAGQQTYLNAMVLGKPVIVTAAPGVLDYMRPGVTGVVVPPDERALSAAIAHAMDPAHAAHYARMGAAARADVLERFTEHTYREQLLRLAGLID